MKWKTPIILLLTIAGFLLRIWDLGKQSIWIDESFTINAVNAIFQHGYPLLKSGWVYGATNPLNLYVISFFSVFGEGLFWYRIASVLFGTGMIVLAYLAFGRMFNKRIGLITAFFVAFSFWEIVWARQARSYMQLQFLFWLSIFLFYIAMEKLQLRYFLLCFVSTILTILTHSFGYSLLMIFPLYAVFDYKKILKLDRKTLIVIGVLGFSIIAYAFYALNVLSLFTFKFNYALRYLDFLWGKQLFFLLGIVGLAIGFRKYLKPSFLLVLSFIVPFYFISFHVELIHFRYMFLLFPVFLAFSALSIEYLAVVVEGTKAKKYANYLLVGVMVFLLFTPYLNYEPRTFYWLERETPQPNFKDAYAYVSDNIRNDEIVIASWPTVADFYSVKSDYWMAFDMSGGLMGNVTTDRYLDTPTITGKDEFLRVVNNSRGWIVIDNLAARRIAWSNVVRESAELEFKDIRDGWSGVYVYRFEK